ncbi:MAG: heme-binding protein [Verrucomicrobiota bacterium]|nr:heme-binding protein [Verrucomicrobiota bacterium]
MHRLIFVAILTLALVSPARAQLTATDVQRIITQGVSRATRISPGSVIAVTDREGFVLGVWNVRGGEPSPDEIANAVSRAGTAAFLSSNSNAFSTRTAGFIIQQHFPPGVKYTSPGPLVGVGFSNLPFSDVNRFKRFLGPVPVPPLGVSPGTRGFPIPGTSLDGSPGGLPLYKNGRLVGGVGVFGDGSNGFIADYDRDEDVALSAQKGFAPDSGITAADVFINGFALAYINSSTSLPALNLQGNAAADYPIQDPPPPFPYPIATFSGVAGQVRQTIMGDPILGTINGQPRLTQAEVERIVAFAADRVRTTRAGIRLPIGTHMEAFITVVNNPNIAGLSPTVLAAFRTGDATMFSWDVAVQKGRTALGFSSNNSAYSTRTVGFLAEQHYPPGIDPNPPGPLNGQQEMFSGVSSAPGSIRGFNPAFVPDPRFRNGITIFPGGFPLYRNGQLIGAVGISGDGVDQDDIVGASGTQEFLAAFEIRADQIIFKETRLPYAKFPRDPEGVTRESPADLGGIAAFSSASAELANISIRLQVDPGERAMIGGFIITGDAPKTVAIRALGPSLTHAGLAEPLPHPFLQLHDSSGAIVAKNRAWLEGQADQIVATGLMPSSEREAAAVQTLAPGAYTASVSDADGGSGIGLLEIYDLDREPLSHLGNISARGFVGGDDSVLIEGFIVAGNGASAKLVVRGMGPSLALADVAEPLGDPVLEIRDADGVLLAVNDNWADTQSAEIEAEALAPPDPRDSALVMDARPGAYTAMLRGADGATGVGVLEIYKLP